MKVEDAKRLAEKELREKNKKQRFDIRYNVEENLHVRGIEERQKAELQRLNRVNYRRYVEYQDRGFDIMTNERLDSPREAARIFKPQVAEKPRVWDVIQAQKEGPAYDSAPPVESEAKDQPLQPHEENGGKVVPASKRSRASSHRQEPPKPIISSQQAQMPTSSGKTRPPQIEMRPPQSKNVLSQVLLWIE